MNRGKEQRTNEKIRKTGDWKSIGEREKGGKEIKENGEMRRETEMRCREKTGRRRYK